MSPETMHSIRKVVRTLEGYLPAPDLRKGLIRAAAENAQSTLHEQELLNSLFGEDTMHSFRMPGEADDTTNLFYGLFRKVYDNGINRAVSTKVSGEMTDSASPVHILSRGAFMGNELQKIEQGGTPQFALLDLKNMRGADFHTGFEDESTFIHRPADVVANKFAQVLHIVGRQMNMRVGRYGGDEFVLGATGNDRQKIDAFIRAVEAYIQQNHITGIFRTQKKGVTTSLQRKLLEIKSEKGAKYDHIVLPTDPNERVIMIDFLKRGLLLTDEQTKRIIDKYSEDGHINLIRYRADFPENQLYPNGVNSVGEKIAHMVKRYPELGIYFELAKRAEDNERSTQKQENLLNKLENSLFDRLIGEYTYARGEFQHNLEHRRYDQVRIIDLKFIKEMNTKMTYADADLQIRRVWDRIDEALGSERDLVQISRLGGSYVIGVLKGKTLSNEAQSKLDQITSLDLFGNKDTTIPLSNIVVSINGTAKLQLGDLLSQSNGVFYTRLIEDLILEAMRNPTFIPQLKKARIQDKQVTKPNLYHMYLKGTRKEERLYEAEKVFTSVNIQRWKDQYGASQGIIDQVQAVLFSDTV